MVKTLPRYFVNIDISGATDQGESKGLVPNSQFSLDGGVKQIKVRETAEKPSWPEGSRCYRRKLRLLSALLLGGDNPMGGDLVADQAEANCLASPTTSHPYN